MECTAHTRGEIETEIQLAFSFEVRKSIPDDRKYREIEGREELLADQE